MGANEARHVLAMADDLGKVLALELYTAAQALDLRRDMINAARDLADARRCRGVGGEGAGRAGAGHARSRAASSPKSTACARSSPMRRTSVRAARCAAAHAAIRTRIPFLDRDRALDGDVAMAVRLVTENVVLDAARAALND